MSYFPTCDFGPHAWLKKKHLVYVGRAVLGDVSRYRLRFCAEHLAVLEEDLAERDVDALNATVSTADRRVVNCLTCDQPINETGIQFFVTCYPAQDERKDYWFRVHAEHQPPAYLIDPYS